MFAGLNILELSNLATGFVLDDGVVAIFAPLDSVALDYSRALASEPRQPNDIFLHKVKWLAHHLVQYQQFSLSLAGLLIILVRKHVVSRQSLLASFNQSHSWIQC